MNLRQRAMRTQPQVDSGPVPLPVVATAGHTCTYFGAPTNELLDCKPIHGCQMHGTCVTHGGGPKSPSCDTCSWKLLPSDPAFGAKWVDQLKVMDRERNPAPLRNMLMGHPAFLVCGGPSFKEIPKEQLSQRGVFTLAVNNVGATSGVRPSAFCCSDPPMKFSSSIWLDPGVMKFVPHPLLFVRGRGDIRRKLTDGTFEWIDRIEGNEIKRHRIRDCPNVWAVQRRPWLKPDDSFFLEESVTYGNFNAGVAMTGEEKTICTMLMGLRVLRYLGAKTVFLLGVDFWMDPTADACGNYSFGEERNLSEITNNNRQYGIVNDWLCRMQQAGVFKRFGLEVYNCYQRSGLRAFAYVPFRDAFEFATDRIDQDPDLKLWYDKN